MSLHDITDLETALHEAGSAPPAPDLTRIRRGGARRRRVRRALGATLVLGAFAVVGVAGQQLGPLGGDTVVVDPAQAPADPTELSALAKRALEEMPGARKVSDWQVVLPAPPEGTAPAMAEPLTAERFAGEPVPMGTRWYTGVTAYDAGSFPGWLHRGVEEIEKEMGDDEGYPVGSTDMGLLVEAGSVELACMAAWDYNAERLTEGPCHPALVGVIGDERYYLWGMGTDDFLRPGEPMELFSSENYVGDAPSTLWIGGVDGTEVASVEFVTVDGTVLDGTVASGSLVPGETMFWADVTGELAQVRIYDASGELLENHPIRPCSDPVDCEVR